MVANENPVLRVEGLRRTVDGRNQVLIFRKAAPIGSRKWAMRRGRIINSDGD